MVLEGHCRLSSFKGVNFLYLVEGSLSIGMAECVDIRIDVGRCTLDVGGYESAVK